MKRTISLSGITTLLFPLLLVLFFLLTQHSMAAGPVSCGTSGADPKTCIPTGSGATVNQDSGSGKTAIDKNSGSGRPAINPTSASNGGCEEGKICNPLKSQKIPEFLLKIIDVLLIFALPLVVLYIMYAGFLFVTAAGNSEQISSARTALLWAVVGGVIVLGAEIIIDVIQGTVEMF